LHLLQHDTRSHWTERKSRYTLRGVPQQLPRFVAALQRREDDRKLMAILLETGEALPVVQAAGSTSGGDEQRLRGLPAIGRGVSGAIRGTDPLGEVIRRESRRRR
jgi:hypothetical protein